MLGLPDGVTACLFDLDGVLTDTAAVHDRAWTEMFDAFLKERAERHRRRLRAVRPRTRTIAEYVDGRPRGGRRARLPGQPRHRAARGRARTTRRTRRPCTGSATARTSCCCGASTGRGRGCSRARAAYLEAARDAGLRRAVVSSSANTGQVLEVTGLADYVEVRGRRRHDPARSTCAASRRRTRSSPRRSSSASGRPRRAVFEDATAGVEAGRAGTFRYVVGVDRVGHAAELLASTAPTWWSPTWPSCSAASAGGPQLVRRSTASVPGRAVDGPGDVPRPRPAGPVRVGVRAVQRAHRPARQPRRGRAARHPRHLPQLVLRAAPAAVRRGRLRLPGVRPDDRQRHQRQADPAAGRRRAVRRPVRRAARPRAGARPAGRHADPRRWTGPRRPAGGSGSAPPGWCRCPSARSPRSSTRSSRSTGRSAAIVQSELVANEALPRELRDATRGSPRCWSARWRRSSRTSRERGAVLVHRTRRSDLQMAAGMDHVVEAPGRVDVETAAVRGLGPHHGRLPAAAGRAAAAGQAASPTAGRACGPGRRCATRSSARSTGARFSGFEGLLAEQRAYLDEFWDAADVEVEGDAELQQAVRFGLFHVLQAGARAERRGDPGQGPDRSRVRRAHVLGHRGVRAAGARPHRAGGRRRRAALAVVDPRPGQGPGADARAGRCRVPVADDRRRGVLRLLAGRHRRVPRQRRHRRRGRAAPHGHRGRGAGGRVRRRDPGRDGPAVDVARATTDRDGQWHIVGVTGPDEYTAIVRRQRLHEPGRGGEPHRGRGRGRAGTRTSAERLGGHRGRGDGLAGRGRGGAHPVRRAAAGAPAVGELHRAAGVGLRPQRALPAAAARAVLRPLPQAGHQAGRPGAGDALVRRPVQRRGQGPQRRLLRAPHGPRLVPVGVHPGRARGRGRAPRSWPTTTRTRRR